MGCRGGASGGRLTGGMAVNATHRPQGAESLAAIIMANGDACPLALQCHVPHKALLDIAGRPMIEYVWQAVQACPQVRPLFVACLQEGAVAEYGRKRWPLAEALEPSFEEGLAEGFRQLPDEQTRALIVTCDMPLLTPEAVRYFVQQAQEHADKDVLYGIVPMELVRERFPQTRRTALRTKEGEFTAAGLGVLSRRFIQECGPQLMHSFRARKSKLALARMLGVDFVLRLALGKISLPQIVARAEKLLQASCAAIILPYPECGFDVDSAADLELARQLLSSSA